MKEFNDDIDDLFRKVIEPNEILPSGGVWNNLDNRLNRSGIEQYKRSNTRYKLLSITLVILLLVLGGYEVVSRHGQPQPGAEGFAALGSKKMVETEKPAARESKATDVSAQTKEEKAPEPESGDTKQILNQKGNNKAPSSGLKNGNSSEQKSIHEKQIGQIHSSGNPAGPVSKPGDVSQSVVAAPVVHSPASELPGLTDKNERFSERKETPSVQMNEMAVRSTPALDANGDAGLAERNHPEEGSDRSSPKANRFSIIGFYSPELSNRIFTKDHDSDDGKMVNDDDYKEREAIGYSYSSGLKIGYSVNSNWTVLAGLGYFAISQRISPMTVFSEPGADGVRHYVLNTSSGSAELPNNGGNAPRPTDSLLLNTSSQALKFINLPVTIQYGKTIKRFCWYVFTGLSLNYLVSQKLIVELPSSGAGADTYSITNVKGVNKFNLGFVAGLGAGYSLSRHLSLHLEPGLKATVSPINTNTTVQSYPYSLGLSFGLGYHF